MSEKTRVVGIVVKTKTVEIVVSNGTEYLMYSVLWSTEGLKRNTKSNLIDLIIILTDYVYGIIQNC